MFPLRLPRLGIGPRVENRQLKSQQTLIDSLSVSANCYKHNSMLVVNRSTEKTTTTQFQSDTHSSSISCLNRVLAPERVAIERGLFAIQSGNEIHRLHVVQGYCFCER